MAPEGYPAASEPPKDVIHQGYMLKKKRKKMQGMARRYFWLSQSGTLSYSFNPDSPIRDSISVNLAYITASRKTRAFHIDSGKSVYHCKALTTGEFEKWVQALKGVNDSIAEKEKDTNGGGPPRANSGGYGAGNEGGNAMGMNQGIENAINRMAQPLQDLEALLAEIKAHTQTSGSPSPVTSPHQSTGSTLKSKLGLGGNSSRRSTSASSKSQDSDYFDSKNSKNDEALINKYANALGVLKAQYEFLSTQVRSTSAGGGSGGENKSYASRSSAFYSSGQASSASINSSNNGGANEEFYDAVPGEFVLDEGGESSDEEDEDDSVGESSFTSVDDEASSEGRETSPEAEQEEEGSSSKESPTSEFKDVKRRNQLPKPQGEETSMIGMLRKNVGKDLSQISFPVTMNEPLSALQRIAEELEYSELLDKAAKTKDSIERLALVTAFAISGNSGNKYRSSRKPFNPLLGETYECVRPDKGFKFVSEKVSHHPPVLGFHSEASGWDIDGYIAPSQKFWGRSMEIMVSGEFSITFKDTKEKYTIKKPSSFIRNLMAGTKYLEVVGTMTVTNEDSGESASVDFKEGSTWGGASTRNKLVGQVKDSNGSTKIELVGRWDEEVSIKTGKDSFNRLWSIKDFPSNAEKYYGFSTFASQLNEITGLEEEGKTAPTDSRLRPDQRMMEEGKIDEAEETKKRVEEKQRSKRKDGPTPKPQWFTQEGEAWKYNGEYFKKREEKKWEDPDIF